MDYQQLFNWAIAIINILIGIGLRALWDSLKDLRTADEKLTKEVGAIQILVAGEYVKREYFEKKVDAIFLKLDRIESGLYKD